MNYTVFFNRNAKEVAKDLIGRLLVRNTNRGTTAGKIIETGAYEGGSETPSRQGMKYSAGKLFLMPFRGSLLLNIATDKEGYPSCVEIRQVAVHDKTLTGSGLVSKFFEITSNLDGLVLGNEVQIIGEPAKKSKLFKLEGQTDNCLGYFLLK